LLEITVPQGAEARFFLGIYRRWLDESLALRSGTMELDRSIKLTDEITPRRVSRLLSVDLCQSPVPRALAIALLQFRFFEEAQRGVDLC